MRLSMKKQTVETQMHHANCSVNVNIYISVLSVQYASQPNEPL